MNELRCEYKLHGILDEGVLKVRCKSSFCGSRPNVIVEHHFDVFTGEMIDTRKFKEVKASGTRRARSSLRTA